jgi:ribonuclease P protein component
MIARKHTVPLRTERSFFSKAQVIRKSGYSIFWQPNTSHLLFQTVVKKKSVSTIVARNQQKRLVATVFESLLKEFGSAQLSIVVLVQKAVDDSLLQELHMEMKRILNTHS